MGASACRGFCSGYWTEIEDTAEELATLERARMAMEAVMRQAAKDNNETLLGVCQKDLAALNVSINTKKTELDRMSTRNALETVLSVTEEEATADKADIDAKADAERLQKLIVASSSRVSRTNEDDAKIAAVMNARDRTGHLPVVREEPVHAAEEEEHAPLIAPSPPREEPMPTAARLDEEEERFVELA